MVWIVTDPPRSLKSISDANLSVKLECLRCGLGRSLRPPEIDELLRVDGKRLTLNTLKHRFRCTRPDCGGPLTLRDVEAPMAQPAGRYVNWSEYLALTSRRS